MACYELFIQMKAYKEFCDVSSRVALPEKTNIDMILESFSCGTKNQAKDLALIW